MTTETRTRPAIAPATFDRIARQILRNNGAGRNPHPALVEDTARELAYQYDTTGLIPTAHQSRVTVHQNGAATWACTCGRGSKTPASSRYIAGDRQSKHVTAARRTEAALAATEIAATR